MRFEREISVSKLNPKNKEEKKKEQFDEWGFRCLSVVGGGGKEELSKP